MHSDMVSKGVGEGLTTHPPTFLVLVRPRLVNGLRSLRAGFILTQARCHKHLVECLQLHQVGSFERRFLLANRFESVVTCLAESHKLALVVDELEDLVIARPIVCRTNLLSVLIRLNLVFERDCLRERLAPCAFGRAFELDCLHSVTLPCAGGIPDKENCITGQGPCNNYFRPGLIFLSVETIYSGIFGDIDANTRLFFGGWSRAVTR